MHCLARIELSSTGNSFYSKRDEVLSLFWDQEEKNWSARLRSTMAGEGDLAETADNEVQALYLKSVTQKDLVASHPVIMQLLQT